MISLLQTNRTGLHLFFRPDIYLYFMSYNLTDMIFRKHVGLFVFQTKSHPFSVAGAVERLGFSCARQGKGRYCRSPHNLDAASPSKH